MHGGWEYAYGMSTKRLLFQVSTHQVDVFPGCDALVLWIRYDVLGDGQYVVRRFAGCWCLVHKAVLYRWSTRQPHRGMWYHVCGRA